MARRQYDLGIIGGGAAGLTVASGAAQLGAAVLVVEKEPSLGGDCLHFGCVPSKTLIKSAEVYHHMKSGPAYGLPRVEPPPVDFLAVKARIQDVIAKIQQHDSEERFCGLGAKVEFGSPRFVGKYAIELEGRTLTADRWLIATGSSPAAPPLKGLDKTPHLTNREVFSLDKLPASLIVLGGGPIAIEMAQAFCRLGSRVTVIQRGRQILSKEDPDMAGLVQAALEEEGVRFHLGASLSEVRDLGSKREVLFLDHNQAERRHTAEAILVALGRKANLEGLGLGDIGVEHTPRGLKLDERLRTNLKHIYGAGDVTGGYQFTHAAGYEGGVVLANAVFRLPRKADYTYLPWCTYSQPELASIGLNQKRADEARIEYTLWEEEFSANDRALAMGQSQGKLKMLLGEDERPLGIQICGPGAGELVSEWVVALAGKVKLSTLASAVHPYPTLAEINKKAAGSVMAGKLFSERVKKGLKLIFNTKGRACTPQAD